MLPIYNLTCLSLKEKPWLEPYDSTDRLNYYIFENNQRLRFKFMSFPNLPTNPLQPYQSLAALANEADIATFPISPNERVIRDFNASFTVPFMYSYNIILTRKNATVKEDVPGPFNNMLNISFEVWVSIAAILFLLAMVGILEERMNGIKRAVVGSFADKIYDHYKALLGQGISLPSMPAIRISNGVWLLELLIFINLFGGLMKANYTARPIRNVNSIKDLSKAPHLYVAIYHENELEICKTEVDSFKNLCKRVNEQNKRMNFTYAHFLYYLQKGKGAWIGDFNTVVVVIDAMIQNPLAGGKEIFLNNFYMSSNKYFTKPIIYFFKKDINTEALKIINKRLRSFFETSQFVVWLRRMEKNIGINFEPSPYTPTNANCQPIRFEDIRSVFALWIVILSISPLLAFLEVLTYWHLRESTKPSFH